MLKAHLNVEGTQMLKAHLWYQLKVSPANSLTGEVLSQILKNDLILTGWVDKLLKSMYIDKKKWHNRVLM